MRTPERISVLVGFQRQFMKKRPSRAPTQRQLRVGEEIRHALARTLERGDAHDPDLAGKAITVTEVRISPDMRNATAYVLPLGGGLDKDAAEVETLVKALTRARPFLRHQVAAAVHMRRVPDLNFIADASFDEASHIDGLLRLPQVARDLKAPEDSDDGA